MRVKTGLLLTLLLLMSFAFIGCNSKITLTIDPDHYTMAVGDEVTLAPVVKNVDGNSSVEYTISNPEIVSITNHVMKALAKGSTTVEAMVQGHEDTKVTFTVEVKEFVVEGETKIHIGTTTQLQVKVDGTVVSAVEYSSNNPSVATVSEQGLVTGVAEGKANITVKAEGMETTIQIEVSQIVLNITGPVMVEVGKTIQLTATADGVEATNVEWSSSNTSLATVNNQGVVTGVAFGQVSITAKVGTAQTSTDIDVVGEDNVAPTITLDTSVTQQNLTLNYNSAFNPLEGIKAEDERDGEITSKIKIDGNVNTRIVGEYTLTYTVEDAAGNVSNPLVRKITVIWNYNITFIGHAGCYSGLMNTEEAFIKAATLHGYQAIECDVKQTKDGVFVTCHDDTFGGKALAQTNWNDIKDVEITQTRGGVSYTSKICTFKRYLEICKQYNVKAVVELKSSAGITNSDQSRMGALMKEIEEVGMVDNVIFLGSQYNCLIWTRNNGCDTIPCQYLVNSIESETFYNRCLDNDLDISFNVDPQYNNSQEWIDRYHEAGIKVACYTFSQYQTVNDLQKWIDMGVDFVTCDVLRPYEVKLPEYHEEPELPMYTVTFEDWDGRIIKEAHVKEGRKAVSPIDPTRLGYRFTGWSQNFDKVTDNMTVRAQYEIIEYTITYVANNTPLVETSWANKQEFVTELYTDWFNWLDTMVGKVTGLSKSGNTFTFAKNSRTATWSTVEEMMKIDIYDFEVTISNTAYKPVVRESKYTPVEPEIDDNYFLNTEPYRSKYRGMDAYLVHAAEVGYSGYATDWKPLSSGKIQIWFRFHQWQKGTSIVAFDTLPKKYVESETTDIEVTLPTTPVKYTIEEAITLPQPTAVGATFGGWYLDPMCTGDEVKTIEKGSTGNVTLYAKWITE